MGFSVCSKPEKKKNQHRFLLFSLKLPGRLPHTASSLPLIQAGNSLGADPASIKYLLQIFGCGVQINEAVDVLVNVPDSSSLRGFKLRSTANTKGCSSR
jgi:hypothetical protein